jgi:hypothetical protein
MVEKNYAHNMSASNDQGQGSAPIVKNSKQKFHSNSYKVTTRNGAAVA